LTLSASDPTPGSGLSRIQLSKRRLCLDCAWSTPVTVSTTARITLGGEGAHQVRVRALDKAGHYSAWTAPKLVVVPRDNGAATVVYEGIWNTPATSGSFLGNLHASTDPAAALETTGDADRLAVIGTRAPDAAPFSVYVDGVLVATVNPVSDTVRQRVVLWTRDVVRGKHTVRIEVDGEPLNSPLAEEDEPARTVRVDAIALARKA